MANLRCPTCGRENPDLLDVCQFCQMPLRPESTLRIGENPTKKNTGELESILPDWLRDVRQQAKDSAEQDEAETAAVLRNQPKDEPPDLLAGLASQGSGEDDDVPDWLSGINPTGKQKPAPAAAGSGRDFFAQFDPEKSEPDPADELSRAGSDPSTPSASPARDELSEWLAQASERPFEDMTPEGETGEFSAAAGAPAEAEEDLGWLRTLEASASQASDSSRPPREAEWTADFESTPGAAPGAHDDLKWLDRLGGIEETSRPGIEPPAAASGEDLSWLNDLGAGPAVPAPDWNSSQSTPAAPGPFAADADLDWFNRPPGASDPGQPVATPGGSSSQQDLSWLNELGGPLADSSAPPFSPADAGDAPPRQTAPLRSQSREEMEPDWLRRAAEGPSMPAPGDPSSDWFSGGSQAQRESSPPSPYRAAPFQAEDHSAPGETPSLPGEDMDSLFSVEMPDWLSGPERPAEQESVPGDESLAPVDLPSWVQAMRPVEAAISETPSSAVDEPAETQGPLAGLHGVIPLAPIGVTRRPKAVSLTLRTSEGQQASAQLLEQILGAETSPRSLVTPSLVRSQEWLRWVLTALLVLVLSSVILLRSETMPVSAGLPASLSNITNAIMAMPVNSKILVVMDYEPSLAGEMEATAGPLLHQIVLLNQPVLSFLSTSPNGPALAERLLGRAGLREGSLSYQHLGYLPGGSAGAAGFIEMPAQVIPAAGVGSFRDYAAIVLLTDQAESGRVWVEQLQTLRREQGDAALASQPLLVASSAQARPMLEPYLSSGQITGMISGLSDAVRYETANTGRPGLARAYWDTLGTGLLLSVILLVTGGLWSLLAGLRARRLHAGPG